MATGGCGEGDDGGDAAPPTTLSPEGRARAVNLQLEDLPPEFAAVPRAGGDDEGVGGCIAGLEEAVVAEAQTPLFERPTESGLRFVRSRTALLDDEETASAVPEALRQPATVDCLREGFVADLLDASTGAQVQGSELGPTEGLPPLGEESTALAGSVTVTTATSEQPLQLSYSVVLVRTDTVVSVLLFGGLADVFPADTAVDLARVLAERQVTA